jgi:hypothetical protein
MAFSLPYFDVRFVGAILVNARRSIRTRFSVHTGAFAAPPAAYGAVERFLTDFDIKILRSAKAASTPHRRSPTSAIRPAGLDLGAPSAPGIDDTTAPIAAQCQSFLDNVVAQFAGIERRMIEAN